MPGGLGLRSLDDFEEQRIDVVPANVNGPVKLDQRPATHIDGLDPAGQPLKSPQLCHAILDDDVLVCELTLQSFRLRDRHKPCFAFKIDQFHRCRNRSTGGRARAEFRTGSKQILDNLHSEFKLGTASSLTQDALTDPRRKSASRHSGLVRIQSSLIGGELRGCGVANFSLDPDW